MTRARELRGRRAAADLVLVVALLGAVSAGAQGPSYRIEPGDRLRIQVAELPDLDREISVDADGTFELPNVGRLEAAGLSELELARELGRRLEAAGARRATVNVRIAEFSRPVAVLGAVAEPGNQQILGRATLLEVLLLSGGLAADHDAVIQVRRRATNGLADQVTIDVADLFERGDPAVNIPIFAGDVVHVPRSRSVRIHFLGEVQTAGEVIFQSTERATLLVAISRAGGLSGEASNKIRILRGAGDEKMELVANYRRILAGKDADVELEDGDIVIVKESFF